MVAFSRLLLISLFPVYLLGMDKAPVAQEANSTTPTSITSVDQAQSTPNASGEQSQSTPTASLELPRPSFIAIYTSVQAQTARVCSAHAHAMQREAIRQQHTTTTTSDTQVRSDRQSSTTLSDTSSASSSSVGGRQPTTSSRSTSSLIDRYRFFQEQGAQYGLSGMGNQRVLSQARFGANQRTSQQISGSSMSYSGSTHYNVNQREQVSQLAVGQRIQSNQLLRTDQLVNQIQEMHQQKMATIIGSERKPLSPMVPRSTREKLQHDCDQAVAQIDELMKADEITVINKLSHLSNAELRSFIHQIAKVESINERTFRENIPSRQLNAAHGLMAQVLEGLKGRAAELLTQKNRPGAVNFGPAIQAAPPVAHKPRPTTWTSIPPHYLPYASFSASRAKAMWDNTYMIKELVENETPAALLNYIQAINHDKAEVERIYQHHLRAFVQLQQFHDVLCECGADLEHADHFNALIGDVQQAKGKLAHIIQTIESNQPTLQRITSREMADNMRHEGECQERQNNHAFDVIVKKLGKAFVGSVVSAGLSVNYGSGNAVETTVHAGPASSTTTTTSTATDTKLLQAVKDRHEALAAPAQQKQPEVKAEETIPHGQLQLFAQSARELTFFGEKLAASGKQAKAQQLFDCASVFQEKINQRSENEANITVHSDICVRLQPLIQTASSITDNVKQEFLVDTITTTTAGAEIVKALENAGQHRAAQLVSTAIINKLEKIQEHLADSTTTTTTTTTTSAESSRLYTIEQAIEAEKAYLVDMIMRGDGEESMAVAAASSDAQVRILKGAAKGVGDGLVCLADPRNMIHGTKQLIQAGCFVVGQLGRLEAYQEAIAQGDLALAQRFEAQFNTANAEVASVARQWYEAFRQLPAEEQACFITSFGTTLALGKPVAAMQMKIIGAALGGLRTGAAIAMEKAGTQASNLAAKVAEAVGAEERVAVTAEGIGLPAQLATEVNVVEDAAGLSNTSCTKCSSVETEIKTVTAATKPTCSNQPATPTKNPNQVVAKTERYIQTMRLKLEKLDRYLNEKLAATQSPIFEKAKLKHLFGVDKLQKQLASGAMDAGYSGYHHDKGWGLIRKGKVEFLSEPQVCPKTGIVHVEKVAIEGKLIKQPKTFFPPSWTRKQVIDKIVEASQNVVETTIEGPKTIIKGATSEGIVIKFIINEHKTLISAYPFVE